MIVDDADHIRTILAKILTWYQIEVVIAEDGVEAVEMYQEQKPDMVFMDINMPKMDGLTATKEIKSIDGGAKICVISALGQNEIVKKALVAGAINYIVKPFRKPKIVQIIEGTLGIKLQEKPSSGASIDDFKNPEEGVERITFKYK